MSVISRSGLTLGYLTLPFLSAAGWPVPTFRDHAPSLSSFQDVDGALEHAAGGADHVDIGLVGTLGLAHVGHFQEWIDVGIFDIAVLVGGGMAGLVFQPEFGVVGARLAELDQLHVERAIDLGLKARHLAPVRLGAR